ncbi:MAG: amino acid permease, partial [Raoultibacter sp.]
LVGFLSITAAMVMSVHEYPTFAVAGLQIPFFLLLSGFVWFLPVAVCSAEMATVKGWEDGGIFAWVGNMLGTRFGFAAVFFQWFQITICFVVIIYFGLSALAYLFDFSALNDNPLVKTAGVLIVFWVLSFLQLGGTKRTARFAKFGFTLGVLIPTVLLIVFCALYVGSGKPLQL